MNYDRTNGAVGLMVAILGSSANLHGARCTSTPDLFDTDIDSADLGMTDAARWAEVQGTCVRCPVRGACWAWAKDQHSGRVSGPTAATQSTPFITATRHRRRVNLAEAADVHDDRQEAG